MDFNMDIDIDQVWSSAMENFQHSAAENWKQSPAALPSSVFLDGDIDIDAIWEPMMQNFKECTNGGTEVPTSLSAALSLSNSEPKTSMDTPSSPSSSSYVPSPHRKSRKRRSPPTNAARKATFEAGVYSEQEDESLEYHRNLGLVLCF
jgi:hypothetical protein